MIGPGDYLQAEFDYTQGASRYSNHTLGTFNYIEYNGNKLGYGFNSDAVFFAGSALELTTAWTVNAAYTHNWNAAWKSSLFGSYMAMDYNSNANLLMCGGAAAVAAGCNQDWAIWGAGLRTQWAVSSTFQIGLEVLYAKLDSASSAGGVIFQNAANGAKPAGFYADGDINNWAVRLRVNRDFYP
jgi:hypothetical protein